VGVHGLGAGAHVMTTIAQAIANRNSVRCNIAVIGDSITEGTGATEFTSRWIQQANNGIRALFPGTGAGTGGGLGFIPIQLTGESLFADPISVTGSTPTPFDLGPVRYVQIAEGTTTWTFTAPAGTTSVQIMSYDAGTSSFPGTWSWQVNAGPVTEVSNNNTLRDIVTGNIAMGDGDVLTIAWVSGTVFIDGIVHFAGDETSGITFHGCGHFGWNSSTVAPDGWNQPEEGGLDWMQTYAALDPSAICIMLGVNDAVTTAGNYTVSEFQTNLTALVNAVLTDAAMPSGLPLILIAEYEVNETFNDVDGWPAYVAAIESVAAGIPGSTFIDLSAVMPPVASAPDDYFDEEHPNDTGHALVAGYVVDAFAAQVPSGGGAATATQPIACNSYVDLNSDMTSSARAGAPYQGNMRQLAIDRWNYMYPSE
jgi:lysophospholipase L1-like esterase